MTAVQNPQDPTVAPPANQHLRAAVQITHEARVRYEAAIVEVNRATVAFEDANRAKLGELQQAKAAAEEAEDQLRTLAVAHYQLTQEKKPVPGVEIKLVTEIDITDPKAALAYAKSIGLCIQLDDKGYKALAKTNDVPGATVTEVPKASIARDLGTVLFGGAQ